jgi:outer membrane protein, heavy metal efflux system
MFATLSGSLVRACWAVPRAVLTTCAATALWAASTCLAQAAEPTQPAMPLPAGAQPPGLSFDAALAMARERASSLAVRRYAVAAAQAQLPAAGQLPDPKLSLGVENLPVSGPDAYSLTRDFMTMRRIGWMQDMPNQRRREAQGQQAAASLEREQALYAADRATVTRETALAWLALYHAQRKLVPLQALTQQNQILQDTLAARITSGQAQAADALTARQEALLLADRRDDIDRDVVKARVALHRWIGDGADWPLAGTPPPWVTGPVTFREQLDPAPDVHRHAQVRVFEPMKRMAQAEVQAAQAEQQGDWGWEVAYSKRGPGYGDMVSFQVRFDLPLWQGTRQLPMVRARQQDLARVEAEQADAIRVHQSEVDADIADLRAVERTADRLRASGLTLAQQRAQIALASYQGGRSDLAMVLAARRDMAEQQIRLIDLEGQSDALRARLNYLTDQEDVPTPTADERTLSRRQTP